MFFFSSSHTLPLVHPSPMIRSIFPFIHSISSAPSHVLHAVHSQAAASPSSASSPSSPSMHAVPNNDHSFVTVETYESHAHHHPSMHHEGQDGRGERSKPKVISLDLDVPVKERSPSPSQTRSNRKNAPTGNYSFAPPLFPSYCKFMLDLLCTIC